LPSFLHHEPSGFVYAWSQGENDQRTYHNRPDADPRCAARTVRKTDDVCFVYQASSGERNVMTDALVYQNQPRPLTVRYHRFRDARGNKVQASIRTWTGGWVQQSFDTDKEAKEYADGCVAWLQTL
jgi:hypothetical protein